jgi:hypothetical protein
MHESSHQNSLNSDDFKGKVKLIQFQLPASPYMTTHPLHTKEQPCKAKESVNLNFQRSSNKLKQRTMVKTKKRGDEGDEK